MGCRKAMLAAFSGCLSMLLVTGGAGFIGSNLIAALNSAGRADIVVNDTLGTDEKWRNLQKRQIADFIPPVDLFKWLHARKLDAVVHLGANSDTTAKDGDEVIATNFRLSLALLDWCTQTGTRFIYASSGATYGDGSHGFEDDWSVPALRRLAPLNLYGWSKHIFDLVVAERASREAPLPPQWVGLKFFNVFGPNEYHKGHMASVLARVFDDVQADRPVRLFKSHREGIADGDQRRDFIYVDDAVAVIQWCLAAPSVAGIFNVGTGTARSFRDLVTALFTALQREPHIDYVDMPEAIRDRYQYFTQSTTQNLRAAGFRGAFTPLEQAVADYASVLGRPDRYR
ncbi:MAG: ADP-L-glycero-D-manno-heptose 6-epimerase [Variibacter sp.]|jgi:ADP-L-glycero-D-manno-heptose 6-epimerase|nr:ADP-L-glycero-D-manno-heptose 6-epimerase [Variibacter sp.]